MSYSNKKYIVITMIFCISIFVIAASLSILNGRNIRILKLKSSVVDSVPNDSLITDVEFYSELVDSYNLEKGTSYGYDHVFRLEELASLTTLSLDEQSPDSHGHQIEDLSGLTYLTGLKNLFIKNINVSSIDLSHNSVLEKVSIYGTGITTVDLSKKTDLTSVDVDIPTLNKLILVGDDNLVSLNTNTPTNPGYIIVDSNRDISYLSGSPIESELKINDNSFGITCDKYNLAIGESTNCTVKGKTNVTTTAIIFKVLTSNGNITVDNYVKKVSELSGDKKVLYSFGELEAGEFDIVSFTVTGVSSGSSKLYLDDYNSNDKIGYIMNDDLETPIVVTEEISKMFYVNKYKVVNSSSTEITTGKLQTNYILGIINSEGLYDPAYTVVVSGDVKADGIINMRDVTKGYKGAMRSNFTLYTEAEKVALDTNFDGLYKLYDVINIYDRIEE